MNISLDFVRTYLAPPMVGAFIGYFTNYVAIKMLFRPLRPWRFLGMRLPFTPGVIPSQRHLFAHNIGEMVGGHLLTSADVSRALSEELFREHLLILINGKVEEVLDMDLGPVGSIIPARFRTYFEAGVKVLRWRALRSLHAYMDSDAFAERVKTSLAKGVDAFTSRKTGDILTVDSQEAFLAFLEGAFAKFLTSDTVREHITHHIQEKIEAVFTERLSCRDLLYPEFIDGALDFIESRMPGMLARVGEVLDSPSMLEKFVDAVIQGIDHFIDSMGPMGAMARNFIEPGTIKEKLKGYFGGKGNVFAEWLLSNEAREKIAAVAREKAAGYFETPLAELFGRTTLADRQRFGAWLAGQIMLALGRPATARMLAELIRERLSGELSRPLKECMDLVFGKDATEEGKAWFTDEVGTALRTPGAKRILDELIIELVEKKILTQPLGPLTAILPREVQNGIGDFLHQLSSEFMVKEVPALIESINIRKIVEHKVDSLDLPRLERLLLSIMQEQFKYINLFGGILGFIIGLVNLLL